jgi:hypothetical protein
VRACLVDALRRRREAWNTFVQSTVRVTMEPAPFWPKTQVWMTTWTGSMACVSDDWGTINHQRVRAIYIGHLRAIVFG